MKEKNNKVENESVLLSALLPLYLVIFYANFDFSFFLNSVIWNLLKIIVFDPLDALESSRNDPRQIQEKSTKIIFGTPEA